MVSIFDESCNMTIHHFTTTPQIATCMNLQTKCSVLNLRAQVGWADLGEFLSTKIQYKYIM